jgi:uncharacterized membrane protein YfcA
MVFAPLVIVGAYVIFAITGFGSTLIAVPLLAHLFPLKFVIPLVVALDCVSSISMGFKLRENVYKKEVLPLLPFMIVGMLCGMFLLLRLPANVLLGALGVLVVLFGISYAVKRGTAIRLKRWTVAPIGLFAGTASSAFGVGGPLYVFFLSGRGATPDQIRATMPVIFIFTSIARIALFAAAGLFTLEVLTAWGLLLPLMVLGLYVGNRLHLNLSRDHVIRLIGGLLTVSGASLILRAIG